MSIRGEQDMESLSRKAFDKEFRKVWKEITSVEIGEGFNEKGEAVWFGVKLSEMNNLPEIEENDSEEVKQIKRAIRLYLRERQSQGVKF